MAKILLSTIKKLFALSGNECAFPGCDHSIVNDSRIVIGEICHIKGENPGSKRYDEHQSDEDRHSYENLILLCPTHHTEIDSDESKYPVDYLLGMRTVWEEQAARKAFKADAADIDAIFVKYKNFKIIGNTGNIITGNTGNVAINSPNSIQANTVNIKTTKKPIFAPYSPGSIGSNPRMTQYISYLIGRYNEFASKDQTRGVKFNYGVISKNIDKEFGSRWRYLLLEKAPVVIEYLHARINKTRLGKINKGKGISSFRTYEEHIQKYG